MKKFIAPITTAISALKLLSNPEVQHMLAEQATKLRAPSPEYQKISKLGTKDIFFHKHFMVQVLN